MKYQGREIGVPTEAVALDPAIANRGKDVITVKPQTDTEINRSISYQNEDGSDWKVVAESTTAPSSYFLAARAYGYFGADVSAVIVRLSEFIGWMNGVFKEPPKPRPDHIFTNKIQAYDWLRAVNPSMQARFETERKLILPNSARSTPSVGMKPLRERANPFK